jgi:predicted phosphodiesterase
MKIGVISDTHLNSKKALEHIIQIFLQKGIELILHCGDIIPEHLDSKLFGGLPVICALINEQVDACNNGKADFFKVGAEPDGWIFTRPDERIVNLGPCSAYVGHKRSFDLLTGSEEKLWQKMHDIRRDNDNCRFLLSGHTHKQTFLKSLYLGFINSGAVEGSFGAAGGHEYAIIDTETDTVIFSRIQNPIPIKDKSVIGLITDSYDISEMVPDFWFKLNQAFKAAEVTDIIHCGNIEIADVGHPELSGFTVHYYLRPDQKEPDEKPDNWRLISLEKPIVEINNYRFLVQLALGPELLDHTEVQIHKRITKLQAQYPGLIQYIFCGQTGTGLLEEMETAILINPGSVKICRDYVIIKLPINEYIFSSIQPDPLPPLE